MTKYFKVKLYSTLKMKEKIKIIAFYLPQFHSIPENDKWWGKGFTDWVNVRKGKAYAKGQEQPRIPLNNNYYDLSNVETLRWQADLMLKYDVFGLCFYHYWFDGKLLLEKPSELLLENKDIPMNFCFSWANEPWARTWDGRNNSVLMPQRYGGETDWKKHFDYLLPFFKDERYIKEKNCPMFVIYRSASIKDCERMMDSWNKWAKENGFNGIHFVKTLRGKGDDARNLPFKASVEFEPSCTDYNLPFLESNIRRVRRRLIKFVNSVFKTAIPQSRPWTFKHISELSLNRRADIGTYGGAFVGWDNTARKGLASTITLPATEQEFEFYLSEKVRITQQNYNTNYVFINAWNEWAEGTYLEPDVIHKFSYLEVIKRVVNK